METETESEITETIETSTSESVCIFNMDTYMEQFGSTPPEDNIIGYVEIDGIEGFSDDEAVYVGDHIEPGVIVHTLCYNCTCEDEIQCVQTICEPCNEGEEEVYVDGDCCPKCIPQEDKCSLRFETKKIEFTSEKGNLCITKSEIPVSYCRGACDSYDSSIVYTLDGEAILHDHECKCCSGTGELVTHTVDCFSEGPREIKIMMFNQCGCNKCAGEELVSESGSSSGNDEESSSVVMSAGASSNSSYDIIAYDSKLRDNVEFQPSGVVKSLDHSNSFYQLSDNSPYMLFLMDIDRQVESISFQTEGKGKLALEVTDSSNKYMLNEKITTDNEAAPVVKIPSMGIAKDLVLKLKSPGKSVKISNLRVTYKHQAY